MWFWPSFLTNGPNLLWNRTHASSVCSFLAVFFPPFSSSPHTAMHDSSSLAFLLPAPSRLRPLNCCSRSPVLRRLLSSEEASHGNQKIRMCRLPREPATRGQEGAPIGLRAPPLGSFLQEAQLHSAPAQFYFSIEIVPGCFVQK